ncbi:MAG TPA: 1,4-alpha-glucan branching protein GlgB [Acidimicrobiia bacterium]|nr:1,4-alpha-glucan branching protein GlgB [Acidimicrobiia bacterium]
MSALTSPITDDDLHWFAEGTHAHLHRVLGAHPTRDGCWFAVWAPNARAVQVVGDFCAWDATRAVALQPRGVSGVWEGGVPGARVGHRYKYKVHGADGRWVDKADPFAAAAELPPATASLVATPTHRWRDDRWMSTRRARSDRRAPISIYEVHLGSWMGAPSPDRRFPTYKELAPSLADHVERCGFTHVELLPVMEHPFYGSWGYQTTGYFAPTARYGTPDEFMAFVDHLHSRDIGVICDWVPSHFPGDDHALAWFDGTALYEHADPRLGHHPDWDSKIFNYGRNEVRSFLVSSATCWLERYHVDGLRVDAVASMLYRDYSRRDGEWLPNELGGRENLEAVAFLRQLNEAVYHHHPDVQTYAEESTAWPGVSRPTFDGGLGFGFKWDMGWMHDTLGYFAEDPVHRRWHHDELTFRAIYAWSESYVLPLSHDEVVHGKGSLLTKLPGDDWQRRANLRLLLGYQWTLPGKKLLFMGGELGAAREWDHEATLDWSLADPEMHGGLVAWVRALNDLYRACVPLHELDCDPGGFEWVVADDSANSVLAWLRSDASGAAVLVVANLTPVPRGDYRIGVPVAGTWRELLNSDDLRFGGAGNHSVGTVTAETVPSHGRSQSLSLTLPPLGLVVLGP